jgi:hypothetical protein
MTPATTNTPVALEGRRSAPATVAEARQEGRWNSEQCLQVHGVLEAVQGGSGTGERFPRMAPAGCAVPVRAKAAGVLLGRTAGGRFAAPPGGPSHFWVVLGSPDEAAPAEVRPPVVAGVGGGGRCFAPPGGRPAGIRFSFMSDPAAGAGRSP